MSNQLLSLGVSGGANAEAPSGKLNLMYGNTGDHHLLEISASGDLYQDFSAWSLGVLFAHLFKGGTELGAYVSTNFTPNFTFGPYWRPYLKSWSDKITYGPLLGLDIGHGVETTQGRFGVSSSTHANQTVYCPSDSTGIFGDDNTVGGCDNRPTTPADNSDTTEETVDVTWSLGATTMLMGWWDITDQWKLDAGIGVSWAIVPEPGASFAGMARVIYKF